MQLRYCVRPLSVMLVGSLSVLVACSDEPTFPTGDDDDSSIGGETPTPDESPPPEGTPADTPEGTPGGTPGETPNGTPEGTPGGTPDEGTPGGTPAEGTPAANTPDDGTPDDGTPVTADLDISLGASDLNFGSVTVGEWASLSLAVSNSGPDALTLNLTITNDVGGDFSLDPDYATPSTVEAVSDAMIWIRFAPTAEGSASGTLTVLSNDPDEGTLLVSLAGEGAAALTEDFDQDGVTAEDGDCDDGDASIYPGATEICDGKDNNCDGAVDEDGFSIFYYDGDGDTYGDSDNAVEACNPSPPYVASGGDCDDGNAAINPAAQEQCDQVDNNCDGQVDEDVTSSYFTDADQDGFGDPNTTVDACFAPTDTVENGGDCDDADADRFPGNPEVCDAKDNDCNQLVDDGLATDTYYVDSDGDGHGAAGSSVESCGPVDGTSEVDDDCDDGDAARYPGNLEVCDQKDNDCNDLVDDGVGDPYYTDADGDGYGDSSTEVSTCDPVVGQVAVGGDCDDQDGSSFPDGSEVCDGADNNCDGQVDEGVLTTYYYDGDGDLFGVTENSQAACTAPDTYVPDGDDCDDADADIYPGNIEVCDSKDNNCDGVVDNGATDAPIWYLDFDGDGYGDSAVPESGCDQPDGFVSNDADCDDADPDINPAAEDLPQNGVDEDCNGEDSPWLDLNSDGYPDLIVTNYQDNGGEAVDSFIYYGDASGVSVFDRQDLPTLGAYHACVADFNDDGWQDVVFANSTNGPTGIGDSFLYWGSPDGFSDADVSELPTHGARYCITADVDNDLDEDIVFANFESGSSNSVDSFVYYNVDGGFSVDNRVGLPTLGARSIRAADLNDDGWLDLIFADQVSGNEYKVDSYIYWGSAEGFAADSRTALPTIGALGQPAVADLNRDGVLDVVMANFSNATDYEVESYLYYGPSYSVDERIALPTNGAVGTRIADVDLDDYLDLVFINYWDNPSGPADPSEVDTYVYYGSSRGFTADNRQSLPSYRTHDAQVGDLNGDEYPDLILAVYSQENQYQTTSWVYWGSSTGYSSGNRLGLDTDGAFYAQISDVDQNGYDDPVFTSLSDGDYVTQGVVYWNSSRGIQESNRSNVATLGALWVSQSDLNGDGYPDLVYANQYTGDSFETESLVVWGGESWSGSNTTALPTLGAWHNCIDDLNQDGYPDIVFANYRNDTTLEVNSYIYWGSQSGNFSADNRTELPTSGARHCLISDLDSDGDPDLVFSNYADDNGNDVASYVYWNTVGFFSTAHRLSLATMGAWAAAAADLDGNGYEELVFSNYTDGSSYDVGLYIYWGDATGYAENRRQTLEAHGPTNPAILQDLDANGYLDIVIAGDNDGDNNVDSYVYWGGANGYNETSRSTMSAHRTRHAAVEDLNLDGYQDIVLATYYDGDDSNSNFIYWGGENGYSDDNRTSLVGDRSTYVAIGDLNLDGLPDLVFSSYWDGDYATSSYIYYGNELGYSTSYRASVDTSGSFHVILADLDLDGRDEIVFASYRETADVFAASSPVYWNSGRGISNINYSELPSYGSRFIRAVNGQ